MQIIKKLAGQTAIYGLSSMLGRFINFLLVIPHTSKLNNVGEYGEVSAIFAIIAFLNIVLTYGLETSYFNFIREGYAPQKVYAVVQKSILFTTFIFAILVVLFPFESANLLGFPNQVEYVYACLVFLIFDTISALPFAKLRQEERPLKFASIKLLNILVNVALNIWFLNKAPDFLSQFSKVDLILIANATASFFSFLVLSPIVFKINQSFDFQLYKKILNYCWPLIFIGLAGIVNETLDRVLLIRLLPKEEGAYQNGIYGAFYKLTMVMTMFVQAYKFAAEPFFFKQTKNQDNRTVYAVVMYWFVGVCALIFLVCMLFIEPLAHLFIKNNAYFEDQDGLFIVPILLLANLFLGVYYNLSIWYKLSNNTKIGALIAIVAAVLTIVLNILLIPIYGFVASAAITLLIYFLMCLSSYIVGSYYFKIPYFIGKYLILIFSGIVLWYISEMLNFDMNNVFLSLLFKIGLISIMMLIIWLLQPKEKNNKFAKL